MNAPITSKSSRLFRSALVAALAAGTLSAGTAHAQNKPDGLEKSHKPHYDARGRMYFRGPWRVSLGLGTAYYNGDLTSSISQNFLRTGASAGVLYRLGPRFAAAGDLSYIVLSARDHLSERNLAFYGHNGVATARLRYALVPDGGAYAGTLYRTPRVMPFVQAGFGLILYSPSVSNYQGGTPNSFDGPTALSERRDYPTFSGIVPLGAGLTFRVTDRLNVTAEGTYYFTNTDSLDDVKFRGNPNQNDGFGTAFLKLEYAL